MKASMDAEGLSSSLSTCACSATCSPLVEEEEHRTECRSLSFA